MDRDAFAARIDHTVLGPETTPGAVEAAPDTATEHGMNACVPPYYLPEAAGYAPAVTLVTVCGFPHGQAAPEAKEIAAEAGVAFIETATGFSAAGATAEDVGIMSEYLPVKASGGIGGFEAALSMFEAGADRVGASAGAAIVEGFDTEAVATASFDPGTE